MEKSPFLDFALFQTDVHHKETEANLALYEERFSMYSEKVDVVVFPELFNTGYANAFIAKPEPMGGYTTRWLLQMARRHQTAFGGTAAIAENGKVFNRFLFAHPDGRLEYYDKRRIFAYSGEDKIFSPGTESQVFTVKGWRIRPVVCFDLRFPEVCRNNGEPWYDVLLVSAHWPDLRILAWDHLIPARAIENQCFVATCNRIGYEGDVYYPGHSCAWDFLGLRQVAAADREEILHYRCTWEYLQTLREQFPVLPAAR